MAHHPQGCKVYLYDDFTQTLPPRYTPRHWVHNQYAAELWLQRSLQRAAHPWRVTEPREADLIYVVANFSMRCVAGKMFSSRFMWQHTIKDTRGVLWPGEQWANASWVNEHNPKRRAAPPPRTRGAVKLVVYGYQFCGVPWLTSRIPPDVMVLKEYAQLSKAAAGVDLVSPFVVSRPAWLTGAEPPPPAPPWASRGLIFFAGHIPKRYISTTRYELWRQLRNEPNVTAVSSTLSCTYGQFSLCDEGRKHRNASFAYWGSMCHPFCPNASKCTSSRKVGGGYSHNFLSSCRSYKHIDFKVELPDMMRDSRRLDHTAYLQHTMSHRFCLIAPGDFVSTHKISEAMALGGAGGCIPLFVIPASRAGGNLGHTLPSMLPYTRWLDYCTVAYLVSEPAAKKNFMPVYHKLAALTEADVAPKREMLRRVRDGAEMYETPECRPRCSRGTTARCCGRCATRLSCEPTRAWSTLPRPSTCSTRRATRRAA